MKCLLYDVRLVVVLVINEEKAPEERSWTVQGGKKNPRCVN